jgi:hypothetical protein
MFEGATFLLKGLADFDETRVFWRGDRLIDFTWFFLTNGRILLKSMGKSTFSAESRLIGSKSRLIGPKSRLSSSKN